MSDPADQAARTWPLGLGQRDLRPNLYDLVVFILIAGAFVALAKHSVRTIPSGPREIMRQFTLEFGEVARDLRHVEASENQLLWLAVEQESEGRLKAALWRMVPARQPVAHFT